MMRTLSRGEAILKYLEIILSLPMYSVHFFDVKVLAASVCGGQGTVCVGVGSGYSVWGVIISPIRTRRIIHSGWG